MSSTDPFDDPVPRTVVLSLDDAFRVLEAIENAVSRSGNAVPLQGCKTSWPLSSGCSTVGWASTKEVRCD